MNKLVFIIFFSLIGFAGIAQSLSDINEIRSEVQDLSRAVQIYPNPATEFLEVKIDHINIANVKLTVHNIIGNEIYVETEKVSADTFRLRVKDLNSGYYLLALRDEADKFRGTYKFVKR